MLSKAATLALALTMGLTSCATLAPNADEWTDHERISFGLTAAAHVADTVTTLDGLDRGCTELNPLLGSHPNAGSIIALKALALGVQYAIYNSPNMGDDTHVYGYIVAAFTGGVATWNAQQDCM